MRAALHEAAEIYMHAKQLADAQVRRELMDTWMSEPHAAEAQPGSAAPDAGNVAHMASFWLEQGLNTTQAERVSKELLKQEPRCEIATIAAKMNRLYRILPEANIPLMIHKDTSVLDLDVSAAVRNLVLLVGIFESGDVVDMVTKEPCLLAMSNLEACIDRTVAKLVELHPSRSIDTVKRILEEHPQLITRMDYYPHVMTIDELPIEIQNMMIIADQGLGFLHRYYRNKRNQSTSAS
jgi:hypothetical protein